MAQKSLFWTTDGVGDGPAAGYSAADFYNFLRRLLITDQEASQGVLQGVNNELAVSGSASPLTVASGAAIVYGLFYENSSPLSLAVGIPVNGITGGRVVLRADWATQTVRAVVVTNTDGVSDIPALTQVAGDKWEISLATFTVNQAGQIAVTSARTYCQFADYVTAERLQAMTGLSVLGRSVGSNGQPAAITATADGQVLRRASGVLGWGTVGADGIADDSVTADKIADGAVTGSKIADGAITTELIADGAVTSEKAGERVPTLPYRRGGDTANWQTPGGTDYAISSLVEMQCGIGTVTITSGQAIGTLAVTFPQAFAQPPIVIVTVQSISGSTTVRTARASDVTASGCNLSVNNYTAVGTNESYNVAWVAIGPVA